MHSENINSADIFESSKDYIFKFCKAKLKNMDDAEDAMQEIFLNIYRIIMPKNLQKSLIFQKAHMNLDCIMQ